MSQNDLTEEDLNCLKHTVQEISKILTAMHRHRHDLPARRLADGWLKIREAADAMSTALARIPDPKPGETTHDTQNTAQDQATE